MRWLTRGAVQTCGRAYTDTHADAACLDGRERLAPLGGSGYAADMSSDRPWLDSLRASSAALQGVLGALLEAERQLSPPASPLERLRQITTSPEWAWLQPLYRLIADVDHALAYAQDLPATESAAIGGHARELLSGGGAPPEQAFLEHYRALLQSDPAVAMAHAAALRALQALPAEAADESERLHARHQWNERRRFLRMGQRGRGVS